MESRIIKLKSVELENFKNTKYGKLEFKEHKSSGKISNILGIYGQNGSGKTSVINSLYLLKMAISGQSLNPSFCNLISCDENFAGLNFEFRINDKQGDYKVFYKFEMRKIYRNGTFDETMNFMQPPTTYDFNGNSYNNRDIAVEIFREKLSYSKFEDNQWRKSITIVDYNMDDNDYTFRPIKNYKEAANSTEKKVGFGVAKGLSKENSTSFIFSPKTFSLLLKSFVKNSTENCKIITLIRNFALFNIFVIQNDEFGAISSNKMIPLSFMLENKNVNMRGNIGLNLFDISLIDINKLETVKKILEQINVVLNTLIPKLKIEIKNYGKETLDNARDAFKVELLSVKNNRKIPLKYESEGIKKIVSILSVLIGMYNNENILVAVDELDAGIFEYLLGEILEILSKSAKGQLIFTSHNLRALEKLNKELVIFTTTNENNRYISLSNAKVSSNLRDFYYRGIMLGGHKEELYDETNKYEISYAFRKAWMIGSNFKETDKVDDKNE
ncbi:AAA family ATPase [Terrisporobacter sp.]